MEKLWKTETFLVLLYALDLHKVVSTRSHERLEQIQQNKLTYFRRSATSTQVQTVILFYRLSVGKRQADVSWGQQKHTTAIKR